jgi:integrase
MRKGNITRRGDRSFRIKIELEREPTSGQRRYHLETVRGAPGETRSETKARAKARLVELIHEMNTGAHVSRSTTTVKAYIEAWLASPVNLNPKTIHRYRQLAEQQIYPYLSSIELQKLDESHIQSWHGQLLTAGGQNGKPLSARTVGHAHRLLHTALARAVLGRKVFRNVASLVNPPRVEKKEVTSLTAEQIGDLFAKLQGHRLYIPAVVALGTGLRRGELLALQWQNIDLDAGFLRVERSLGEAGKKLYFKAPKSQAGRRSLSLAPFVVDALRQHRKEQLELRMALGLGKQTGEALVFSNLDGSPLSPDKLSRDWANLVIARKLPRVSFHGLRHSNVSMLIEKGLDVHTVSRRIGHSSASLTLSTYTHMYRRKDDEAADAIEAALTGH